MRKYVFLLFIGMLLMSVNADAKAKNWYEGGNLHQANALAWQTASYNNKLATCADFMTIMWTKKMLKQSILSRINSVNDLRPFAEQLVSNLDDAFKKDPDPAKNRRIFANQKVTETVSLLVVMLGWR